MSRNGSGTYNLPAGNPVVTGTTITSSWANTTMQNIADGLTQSVASDGQTPMSGALNMATNDINNAGIVNAEELTINGVDISGATGSSTIGYNEGQTNAVTRTVQAKLQETVSVKDFGAIGDGTTDDTTAIQNAINSGAARVIFPSGTYVVSGLTGLSNQILDGLNQATLLAKTGSAATVTFITFNSKNNYAVKNFIFDGNTANATNLNVEFSNTSCSYFSYTNNTWKNCNGLSCYIANSSNVNINNNKFINCGIYNITSGNSADRRAAINFQTCTYSTANDNYFDTVGLDCISFTTNCSNVQACRNITKDNYASAVYASLVTNFVISENVSDALNLYSLKSGNGIDVINSKKGTITGNVSTNRGGAGISVANGFDVVISSNTCLNNNQSNAGLGGICIATSTAGGYTPLTEDIVATGNICRDVQGVGSVTQKIGISKLSQTGSVFTRIVIDVSNNLSGYDSGGNPSLGAQISSSFGLVGYPILFNLTTGSSLDLCTANTYGTFSVTQVNNASYYANAYVYLTSTPILLADPASQWTAGSGGAKQNILYNSGTGTIQLQNNTGLTRTYLVMSNSLALPAV